MSRRMAIVGVIGLFTGCHTFLRSAKEHRVVGNIDPTGVSGPVIQAPNTVHVGQQFEVTVTTRGDSCVRADGADVDVRGLVAVIVPRDIVNYAHGCAEYDAPYPRAVKVRFQQLGTAAIRVQALDNNHHPVITERAILVTQ